MIVLIIINTYATRKVKAIETELSNTPAASRELENKRDHIVHIWQKEFLPKFD